MEPTRISAEELQQRLQDDPDSVYLIDVRPEDRFAAGHVPGAVNIPLDYLEDRLADLPKEKPIVTYCGGGTTATKAAELLAERGYEVQVMQGFRYWQAAGLPSETA